MPAESGGQTVRRSVPLVQTQDLVTAPVEAAEASTACPPDRYRAPMGAQRATRGEEVLQGLPTNWLKLRRRLSASLTVLRRLTGMPDYQAYLEHLSRHHPERPIPSEREYFTQYIESRYGNGPSRCC